MAEPKRDPLQKYLVIDGPMRGREFDHPDDYFYMAQINVQPVASNIGDLPVTQPLGRVRYRLIEHDGQMVWSCEQ